MTIRCRQRGRFENARFSVSTAREPWATSADFDDSAWPQAFEFTDEEVGTDHLPAYTRYPKAFQGARWIWSYNLVFDNLVLVRKTVR